MPRFTAVARVNVRQPLCVNPMRRSVTASAKRTCRAFTRAVVVRRRCVSRSLLEGTERATALGCAGTGRSRPPLPLVPRVNRPLAPSSARLRWGGPRQSVGLEDAPSSPRSSSFVGAGSKQVPTSGVKSTRHQPAASLHRGASVPSQAPPQPSHHAASPAKESRTVIRRRSSRSLLPSDVSPCGFDDGAGYF